VSTSSSISTLMNRTSFGKVINSDVIFYAGCRVLSIVLNVTVRLATAEGTDSLTRPPISTGIGSSGAGRALVAKC
jgi:hypothetical protein